MHSSEKLGLWNKDKLPTLKAKNKLREKNYKKKNSAKYKNKKEM